MEKIQIQFHQGYGGGVKCNVFIDGVQHILEVSEAVRMLEKAMTERGYTKTLAPRQKYYRININD